MPAEHESEEPLFFASPGEFEAWLARHHEAASELTVGFHKRSSGLPSLTWAESVDAALCYGWIDGVRRGLDRDSYTIRFTPRRSRSVWSRVNVKRAQELMAEGRMRPAGIRALEARDEGKTAAYSYEREKAELPDELAGRFRAHAAAWEFFQSQPPSYRKPAIWWVISAKREETRLRRLDRLVAASRAAERLDLLRPGS